MVLCAMQIDKYMNANRRGGEEEDEADGKQAAAGQPASKFDPDDEVGSGDDASDDASEDEDGEERASHRKSVFDPDAPSPSPPRKRGGRKAPQAKKRKAEDAGDEPVKEKKPRKQTHCLLSPELQAFLGVETLPRFQVVKELWVYIKANNLQVSGCRLAGREGGAYVRFYQGLLGHVEAVGQPLV
jgi:chromatin remodeling complex protein RSC6